MRELEVLGSGHLKLDFADWKEFFETEMAEQLRSQLRNIADKVSRQEGSCVAGASAIYRASSKGEALRAFRDWKQH